MCLLLLLFKPFGKIGFFFKVLVFKSSSGELQLNIKRKIFTKTKTPKMIAIVKSINNRFCIVDANLNKRLRHTKRKYKF